MPPRARAPLALTLALLGVGLAACDRAAPPAPSAGPSVSAAPPPAGERLAYPGTREGAALLVDSLVRPEADHAAILRALRPEPRDYEAVFVGDAAERVRAVNDGLFAETNALEPREGQTATLVRSVTTEALLDGESHGCPPRYGEIARHLRPGLTIYCFKLVKPGETVGTAFDGLVHVHGHWALFPKPWRALAR